MTYYILVDLRKIIDFKEILQHLSRLAQKVNKCEIAKTKAKSFILVFIVNINMETQCCLSKSLPRPRSFIQLKIWCKNVTHVYYIFFASLYCSKLTQNKVCIIVMYLDDYAPNSI